MKIAHWIFALSLVLPTTAMAQTAAGPTDEKAQKTYAEAKELLATHQDARALEAFKKADKQDGGHCAACAYHVIDLAPRTNDFKAGETAAQELIAQAPTPQQIADAHASFGMLLYQEAVLHKKDNLFTDSDREFKAALAADPHNLTALYTDGLTLSHMKQDDAARAQFQQFADLTKSTVDKTRAMRFVERPDLARARMAPPFDITTSDGKHISLDELHGKIVLLDFWATWCPGCIEALPHMQEIARKFQGEPLVVISISLDRDKNAWQKFIESHHMTWPQYCDNDFTGKLSTSYGVHAIPQTFTIDADGVVQDQQIDGAFEGKLKKLVAQARDAQKGHEEKLGQ